MSHSYPDFHKPFIINEKNMASAIPSRSNVLATKLDGDRVGDWEAGISGDDEYVLG
jgi:hypothetical protein